MPTSSYFKGHGAEVMDNMQKTYGSKKGESVFYATANKEKMKPKKPKIDTALSLLSSPGRKKMM